jgi:hypothetical protein
MAIFNIEITEISQKVVAVEAGDIEAAVAKVKEDYKNARAYCSLTADDLKQTAFCDYDGGGLFGS